MFASNVPSSQKALVPTALTGWQDILFILDTQGLMTFLSSKSFLPLFMGLLPLHMFLSSSLICLLDLTSTQLTFSLRVSVTGFLVRYFFHLIFLTTYMVLKGSHSLFLLGTEFLNKKSGLIFSSRKCWGFSRFFVFQHCNSILCSLKFSCFFHWSYLSNHLLFLLCWPSFFPRARAVSEL